MNITRLALASLAVLALLFSGCDKFVSSTGQALDSNGNLVIYIGMCEGDEVLSVSVKSEDSDVLWRATANSSGPQTSVVTVDDRDKPGWTQDPLAPFMPASHTKFLIEVTVRGENQSKVATWEDSVITNRLSSDKVYLGSRGDYTSPESYQQWFEENACP